MNRLLLVLAFVAVAAARTLPSELIEWEGRVVGGSTVSGRAYPHQVSLTLADSRLHFCGGGLISERWVLSAAHCTITRNSDNCAIWAGTNSRTTGGTRYAVNQVINHEFYDENTLENDISLLESADVITGAGIAFRGLSSTFVGAGVTVHLTGWGQTSHPGESAEDLQWLAITTLSNADCQSRLDAVVSATIFDSKICAFSGSVGAGTCMQDSGGPLVTATAAQTIVGVVSWGIACAQGFPDVYMRVSSYRPWIAAISGV